MASESIKSELIRAARAYQQNHYELCSDWNSFERYQLEYLRDYVGYGVFGPPMPKIDDTGNAKPDSSDVDPTSFAYNEKQQEVIDLLYDKVIEYSNFKEHKDTVQCSTVYNVIFNEEQALEARKKREAEMALVSANHRTPSVLDLLIEKVKQKDKGKECSEPELQYYPVPVFKVKWYNRAKADEKGATSEPSWKVYFIDNGGRVYDGFADYLESNTLPTCTMVLPKNGVYQIDPDSYRGQDSGVSEVWLEILPSPANSLAKKFLLSGDIASTVFATAGMAVGIASMFTPVGPAVAIAGAVGGGVSGLWTAGRSAQHLADRGVHGESISVTDRGALGAWIGVAGGAVGVAATGGTALLSRAIRAGTSIGRVATVAYDAVQIGNLIVNGIGVGYTSYDVYATWSEKGEVSPRAAFFLAAHLFFFCNSVMNARFASTLVETSQAQVLKDYEASLRSNRHRREFQRMARNTRAAGASDVSSNEEIIRGINRIDDRNEFFQSMVRNRKAFSASGAKATFAGGKVSVNSLLTIDPVEFSNLPKDVRADIIRGVSSVMTDNSAGAATSSGIDPFNGARASNAQGTMRKSSSTGIARKNTSGVKPNNVAGSEPKNSAAPKSNEPGTKPKASTGVAPKNTSGVKPNNVAGSEPKNSAAPNSNEPMAPKVKNRPNETSYKNFDTSNGTILKEFCTKHSSARMLTAPPQIADFQYVLKDLRVLPNCAAVFCKLLEIAYRIYVELPRNRDVVLGKMLGRVVDYLWDVIKAYTRKAEPSCLVNDLRTAQIVDVLCSKVAAQVETKVDDWVAGFKQWLEDEFPQRYRF